MITSEELQLARQSLATAQKYGAQKARATLTKSSEDLVATLNAEIDRVTRCEDRSLSLSLIVDGRFGSFSTNKLDEASLNDFIAKSVGIVRMLAADECRDLPAPELCCKDAVTGMENGIYDPSYKGITAEDRCKAALKAAVYGTDDMVISEEGEYSDSEYDIYVCDTQGLECRHTETSFDYGVEVTLEDEEGDRYSGYWWHAAPFFKDLDTAQCGPRAIERAKGQIGSEPEKSGRYNLVVDSDVASKFVSPILNALNAYSIQQNNSFLMDSEGKKIFPEGMTVVDLPRLEGQTGSKFFDSEGVATKEAPIIEKGVVKQYFVNTYMSHKLGIPQTVEDPTRPKVMGWPEEGLMRDDILKMCGRGIYVTDFNGGNSNGATGDFSYGIEGYLFEDGKIVKPVSGMLVTGNFIDVWSRLIACGSDARECMSKLIPTLAFANVDFSG